MASNRNFIPVDKNRKDVLNIARERIQAAVERRRRLNSKVVATVFAFHTDPSIWTSDMTIASVLAKLDCLHCTWFVLLRNGAEVEASLDTTLCPKDDLLICR